MIRNKARPSSWYMLFLGATTLSLQVASAALARAEDVTLVYAVPAVAQNVDPAIWEGDASRWTKWEQGSTLGAYDYQSFPDHGCKVLASIADIKLDLASSWELSADHTYYLVKLKSAKSPSGNTLSSTDVVWSFERQKALSGVARDMFFSQAKYKKDGTIEIVDEQTFKLYVDTPTAMDMPIQTLGPFAFTIYDSVEVKKHASTDDPWAKGWLSNHTANYGPWTAERVDPGNEVVYGRNPNYVGNRGNVDRVVIRAIPDASTRFQLLQAGEVDVAARLSFDEYATLATVPDVTVDSCVSPVRDTLVLQQADKRFADVKVRQAISYAIDRDALVSTVYHGFARPSKNSLPAAYNAPGSSTVFRYDPALAKQLLAEAGYPDGFTASMLIHTSRPGPHVEELAVTLQSQLQQVGLNWKIDVATSAADFATRYAERKFDAILYLDPPAIADPLYTLVNYNASKAKQNTFGYANADYDTLVTKLATILKPGAERDTILVDIDKVVMATMPMIYLVDRQYIQAYRSNVRGIVNAPHGELLFTILSK